MTSILVVFGTRPEAVKLAPVIRSLRSRTGTAVRLCATSQHDEMLKEALAVFDLVPDDDLGLMRPNQRMGDLLGRMMLALGPVLEQAQPDVVVVQGDTLSVMGGALAAFLSGCRIAHVEAGLRTRDRRSPFPEEVCRRVAGVVADHHFAPTAAAREALLAEGVDADRILVTGNTGIDSLLWTAERVSAEAPDTDLCPADRRLVLVTAHRRESFGAPFRELCAALAELVERAQDVQLVWPVHLNPNVREVAHEVLGDHPRVRLLPPVGYLDFVRLLTRAHLVLTDSGGVQEEAPTLGKPVLVLREKTERPEAVHAGQAELVGTDRGRIVTAALRRLEDAALMQRLSRPSRLYGDGLAAERIADCLTGCTPTHEAFMPASQGEVPLSALPSALESRSKSALSS